MLALVVERALWALCRRDIWPEVVLLTSCIVPPVTIALLAWGKAT